VRCLHTSGVYAILIFEKIGVKKLALTKYDFKLFCYHIRDRYRPF
jgi:hypothetical protein